jgi:hypothetical protein
MGEKFTFFLYARSGGIDASQDRRETEKAQFRDAQKRKDQE